ncbi:MAG TPA: hypothetical protein VGJ02_00215 [Pyrinomonadaceae bacterium]|jgi:hypothetical protein
MPKLNWEIVKWNIAEAREQLEEIERQIATGEISEGSFGVMITHAFHHLNFAWNIRRVSTKRYSNLTTEDFNFGGDFPADIELLKNES